MIRVEVKEERVQMLIDGECDGARQKEDRMNNISQIIALCRDGDAEEGV